MRFVGSCRVVTARATATVEVAQVALRALAAVVVARVMAWVLGCATWAWAHKEKSQLNLSHLEMTVARPGIEKIGLLKQ